MLIPKGVKATGTLVPLDMDTVRLTVDLPASAVFDLLHHSSLDLIFSHADLKTYFENGLKKHSENPEKVSA